MDALVAAIPNSDHQKVGGVEIDIVRAGSVRVGRVVYPPGFRWSSHMKAVAGTESCRHAHIGFLARGRVQGTYADGCAFDFTAPSFLVLEPGHDAWVVGSDAAVLIQFDAEADTVRRFGLAGEHRHS
jgi:hypothetical protein